MTKQPIRNSKDLLKQISLKDILIQSETWEDIYQSLYVVGEQQAQRLFTEFSKSYFLT